MSPFVKSVASISGNRRVLVQEPGKPDVVIGGPPTPDPAVVVAQERETAAREAAIVEQEARERAAEEEKAAEAARQAAMHEEIRELLQKVIEGQRDVVQTLHLPVIPTKYDKDGRISEARRRKE